MALAEPERIRRVREDFREYVRKDSPLDHYSEPMTAFLEKHAPEHLEELKPLLEHDRRMILMILEQDLFQVLEASEVAQAAKSHLAILNTMAKHSNVTGDLPMDMAALDLQEIIENKIKKDNPDMAKLWDSKKIVELADKLTPGKPMRVKREELQQWLGSSASLQNQII